MNKRVEILPQSRIDTFLSSTSPEEKYEALLEFWGGVDDSSYYVGVSRLLEYSNINKLQLIKEKENIESKIRELSTNENRVEAFNDLINDINIQFPSHKIKQINIELSLEDLSFVTKSINDKIGFLNSEIDDINITEEKLVKLNNRFRIYAQNKTNIILVEDEILKFKSALLYHEQLELITKRKKEIEITLAKEKKELNDAINIDANRLNYLHIYEDINRLSNEKSKILEDRLKIEQTLSKREEINNENENLLLGFISDEKLFKEQSENLQAIDVLIHSKEAFAIHIKQRIELCKKLKRNRETVIDQIKAEILTLQSIYKLSLESFVINQNYNYSEYEEIANDVFSSYSQLQNLKNDLEALNSEFTRMNTIGENLQKIVELGRNFVELTETDTCPLCQTKKRNYEELLNSINTHNDDFLGVRNLTEKINSLISTIEQHEGSINSRFKSLVDLLIKKENFLNKNLAKYSKHLLTDETLLSYFQTAEMLSANETEVLKNRHNDLKKSIDSLQIQIQQTQPQKTALEKSQQNLKNEIKQFTKQLKQTSTRLKEIEASLDVATNNSVYFQVSQYLKNNFYDESLFLEKGIQDFIIGKDSSVNKFQKQLTDIEKEIGTLLAQTKSQSKEVVLSSLNSNEKDLNNLKNEINDFESIYILLVSDDLFRQKNIGDQINKLRGDIIPLKELQIKLRQLLENVSFLQEDVRIKELKDSYNRQDLELQRLQKGIEMLSSLKEDLSNFLSKKISLVFNQKIINEIYKKIDPHPEFKEIALEPVFDAIRPRLNIKAINSSNNDAINPVLYLSSAQVNILSLSIFLAKALQNPTIKINTIFMDDPIQYLDSINVLSFIDLLRSITTDKSIDRQIVLSTHDENFFNLLKKKLNSKYYNSRFIEFESYGRLKN